MAYRVIVKEFSNSEGKYKRHVLLCGKYLWLISSCCGFCGFSCDDR